MRNHSFTFNEKFCGVAACRLRGSPLPYSAVGRVSLWPCSANERYYILQHYSAGSGGAFAFAEHTELSLASRKTAAFARMSGGNGARLQAAFYAACLKRSLPTACRRCLIPRPGVIALHNFIPRTAHCHSEPPRMRRVEESA